MNFMSYLSEYQRKEVEEMIQAAILKLLKEFQTHLVNDEEYDRGYDDGHRDGFRAAKKFYKKD